MVKQFQALIASVVAMLLVMECCGPASVGDNAHAPTISGKLLDTLHFQLDLMLSKLDLPSSRTHPRCLVILKPESVDFGNDNDRKAMILLRPITRAENQWALGRVSREEQKRFDELLRELDSLGMIRMEYIDDIGAHVFRFGYSSSYSTDVLFTSLSEYDVATDTLNDRWKLVRVANDCAYLTRRY